MKPHKHAAVIKAWADGATIEWRDTSLTYVKDWRETCAPAWNPDYEYRVKPTPHPQQDLVDAVRRGEEGIQVLGPNCTIWVDVDGPYRSTIVFPHEAQLRRRHKWQKEMDAYDAGKAIQCRLGGCPWSTFSKTMKQMPPRWLTDGGWEYRIKPEEEVQHWYIGCGYLRRLAVQDAPGDANLKLTFEDGKLTGAEVL
jgi:hypothetical protein